MNQQQFKAWFDGYSEHITEAPTPEQWARIKEQVQAMGVHFDPLARIHIPLTETVVSRPLTTGTPPYCYQGPGISADVSMGLSTSDNVVTTRENLMRNSSETVQ